MEFNVDWITMGNHRVRLSSSQGFPTEFMRSVANVVRLAVDHNMSARARLVEIAYRRGNVYDIAIGTTIAKDAICASQLEAAISFILGLKVSQINISITTVSQEEVELHSGVYERMLAEKLGAVPPIQ